MLSEEELKKSNRERKARQRDIEKKLTYKAWERYPGESYKDFKRRFTKKVIIITDEELK